MAYFARQKRQSRFYWAELGFIALGLLGLQPSLFTNLISGSTSHRLAQAEALYPTQQNLTFRDYEYLTSPQFASTLAPYPPIATNADYARQLLASSPGLYTQQPLYNASLPVYSMMQPYSPTQATSPTQHYYGATQTNVASTPLYSQPNYAQLSYPQPNYLQQSYSQPSLPPSNTASNYFAQQPLYNAPSSQYLASDFQPARPVYSSRNPNSAISSNNWSASQPSLYTGNANSYLPSTSPSTKPYQNYATNLHNATAPKLTQNQMFENGMNSNIYGAASWQDYRNPANTGNYNSSPSYLAPSPLYR